MKDIRERIKEVISEELKIENVPDDKTMAELGADSLELVELVMAMEEEFAVEIQDRDAENLMTVDKMVEYAACTGIWKEEKDKKSVADSS